MVKVSITQVRPSLRELADKVRFYNERVCVNRNGEPVFAMVSIDDLKLLEAIEDEMDIKAAEAVLKKGGKLIPLEKVRKRLGRTVGGVAAVRR